MEAYREEGHEECGIGFPLGFIGCVKNKPVGSKVFVLERSMSIHKRASECRPVVRRVTEEVIQSKQRCCGVRVTLQLSQAPQGVCTSRGCDSYLDRGQGHTTSARRTKVTGPRIVGS